MMGTSPRKRSSKRGLSTARPKLALKNSEIRLKRNALFEKEKERQKTLIPRIEKIQVNYVGHLGDSTLIMNKDISTPHNCAMHINELLVKRSVLALVNGQPWDMHRPLQEDCELKLLHFRDADPSIANKAFWRSCSYLLGVVAEKAFKDEFYVELHSWPAVNVRSGSFVYDIDLKMDEWSPRMDELRTLSTLMQNITTEDLMFERLTVEKPLALKMFEDNKYKCEQIPKICEKSDSSSVTMYRVGEHIDISQGPMIANTNLIGTCAVASVHKLKNDLHRFQGVAVPRALPVNHFIFDFFKKRAQKLNEFSYPVPEVPTEDKSPSSATHSSSQSIS